MYNNQYYPYVNYNAPMVNPQMESHQSKINPIMNYQMPGSQMLNHQMASNQIDNQQMVNMPMINGQKSGQQMMYAPQPQNMMMDMEEKKLEMMFPKIYYIILPYVEYHCGMMENKYGHKHCPTKEQLEEIKENIYKSIEKELDDLHEDEDDNINNKKSCNKHHENRFSVENCESEDYLRRYRYGRRQAIGDIIGIALLGELLGRRRVGPYVPYGPLGPYVPYGPYPLFYGYGYGRFHL